MTATMPTTTKTILFSRPESHKGQQRTLRATLSSNNPWWSVEPDTMGCIPSMSFLSEEEVRNEAAKLGFAEAAQ